MDQRSSLTDITGNRMTMSKVRAMIEFRFGVGFAGLMVPQKKTRANAAKSQTRLKNNSIPAIFYIKKGDIFALSGYVFPVSVKEGRNARCGGRTV